MSKPFVVGITGGSASGKTLFINKLVTSFSPEQICLISQDEYYKIKELQPLDIKGIPNFDTPFSIDIEQFIHDLEAIYGGKEIQKQKYTFNNPAAVPETIIYKPAPIIVVEGVFVFYFPEILEMLDLKIFIDAKEHIKLKRRLVRDKEERGYDIEDVLYRYEYHVAPTYEKYIEPFRHDADLVIPNNHHFENAMEVLVMFLRSKI
ncbi:MAG: uridine kinase [Cytophagaceae bacterium]